MVFCSHVSLWFDKARVRDALKILGFLSARSLPLSFLRFSKTISLLQICTHHCCHHQQFCAVCESAVTILSQWFYGSPKIEFSVALAATLVSKGRRLSVSQTRV
ncbi:hypothetical protein Scep_016643 [Stephania cephalantha]|uniref:Uncharacterized protein n=1 Tax=Stephania cephalantha TaxID=152367 RepID=A0AAP0INJ8_9MAGN